jgi:hypothetical protein
MRIPKRMRFSSGMGTHDTKAGDKAHIGGHTEEGTVKKVKADGTRVVQTKQGTLKEMKDPEKPVRDRP